jgi:CDP-4-dehydro-6-deoxyglucose reductase, E3
MRFSAELVGSRSLSPSVRSLVFLARPPADLRWKPGQYVELELLGARKPYSIASAMGVHAAGQFEIAVGSGSGFEPLEALPLGSVLTGHGPLGSFARASQVAPGVFVAAGTGLSPFRAMLQHELSLPGQAALLLLYGCRSQADILWHEELAALASEHPRFRFEPTLSQPEPGWTGRRGYVQAHLVELSAPLAERGAEIYVCGPASMVSDCVARLENELGIARERIFVERV